MWPKIIPIAISIARLLLERKDAFKGLDKHERKLIAADAAQSATVAAQLISAKKRFPEAMGIER